MLSYDLLNKGLKKLCKENGLPILTPHELRHSCSDYWVSVGATQVDIGRQLNQKSESTTKGYMHGTDELLDSFAEKL